MTFADFILAHDDEDPVRLLLSRSRYPDVDMDLAASTIEARRRLKAKIPEWHALAGLVYPSRLSAEQCSSSRTALYKARLASGLLAYGTVVLGPSLRDPSQSGDWAPPSYAAERWGPRKNMFFGGTPGGGHGSYDHSARGLGWGRIADLTGGLGVDSWAFAEVAEEVLYNEMNPALCDAARHNFREMGIENIRIENKCLEKGKVAEVLGDFEPDLIYLDPARRTNDGRKVFMLEDCSPDILTLLPELFESCRYLLLKLSPMADISLLRKQLPHIREIHVVASGGECKELLFLLDKEWTFAQSLTIVEDDAVVDILPCEETVYAEEGSIVPGGYIFEPGHALSKSGAFSFPCIYSVKKLAPSTHLYASEGIVRPLQSIGKWYRILEVRHLDKRSIKEMGQRYPQAEVSARNIPMKSEELRERLGCSSGGDIHIFSAATLSDRLLLVCRRVGKL